MRLRPIDPRLLLVATVLVAACSGTATPQPSIPTDAIHLSAKDLKFNTAEVRVPAGKPFTIVLDILESASHDVSIYRDTTWQAAVQKQDPHGGPGTFIFAYGGIAAGTYAFRCDVHPSMSGTVIVGG